MDHKHDAYAPQLAIRAGVPADLIDDLKRAWEDEADVTAALKEALATQSILESQLPITLVSVLGISLSDARVATIWVAGTVSDMEFRAFLREKVDAA